MDNLDWKAKLGAAFNIDQNEISPDEPEMPVEEIPSQGRQMLNIMLDKRNRNGKKVTLITDFVGSDDALKELAKDVKRLCGVGGSARGGEILIQGDFRDKVLGILKEKGYKARII